MIITDGSEVKVGGVLLPGLFKSIEIKGSTFVEEQTVEGKSKKPKQVMGYEDAKVSIEIVLEDSPKQTKYDKLAVIQKVFRSSGQSKPTIYTLTNKHTAIRGISRVLFKDFTTKENNKKSELSVSLEFWEYHAITVSATKNAKKKTTKKKTSGNGSSVGINSNYSSYLKTRGQAPKQKNKTSKSPAVDNQAVPTKKK